MPRTNSIDGVRAPLYESCAQRAVCDEKRRTALVRQLQTAQKAAPAATLAAGLAHDFKNIMTTVRLHSDLIGMSLPADGAHQQHLAHIREAVEHANALLDRLVAFARPQSRRAVLLRPDAELERMSALLHGIAGSRIELTLQLEPSADVRIDPVELQQIVFNCVLNARQAMHNQGAIRVTVRPLELAAGKAREFEPPLPAGHYVELSIRGTGPGIESATVRGAEQAYHKSGHSSGWGLGLTVLHGCAARAGGGVNILSGKGQGTCVLVALPVATTKARTRGTDEERRGQGIRKRARK